MRICLIICSVCIITGCVTTTTQLRGSKLPEDDIPKEEQIQNDVELLVDAMALKNTRMETICKRLIEYGEKAVPELGKNIENRISIVRLGCIYCLGQIYERTKSPKIKAFEKRFEKRLNDPVEKVQLEAAATLCSFQNYHGIPILINALRHKEPYVRMTTQQVLRKTFNLAFGYDHNAPAENRQQAIEKWEKWWQQNRHQYLDPTSNS